MNGIREFSIQLGNDGFEFETQNIQFYDDGRVIIRPISCIKGQSVSGKLLALARLVTNKNAANLFSNENVHSIYLIIKHGQELEKKFAIRLLIQICFHGNNSSASILNDRNLFKEILKLAKKEPDSFDIKSLPKTVKRAVYIFQLLNENLQNSRQGSISWLDTPTIEFQKTHKNKENKPYILISSTERYKSKSTATNEIIKQLELNGFKTYLNWTCDIGLIGNTVDKAFCVICCVTRGYSIDEFCRFEALQSLKSNKPIIPVILKDRFSLDQEKEWLLEMIIPHQPYIWLETGPESFEMLFDKICLYYERETNTNEYEMKSFINNLMIKKRKCHKIVFDKDNIERYIKIFLISDYAYF